MKKLLLSILFVLFISVSVGQKCLVTSTFDVDTTLCTNIMTLEEAFGYTEDQCIIHNGDTLKVWKWVTNESGSFAIIKTYGLNMDGDDLYILEWTTWVKLDEKQN